MVIGFSQKFLLSQKLQTFQFGLIRREKLFLTTDYGITDAYADAVGLSVYCVLALYVPPYIIKLAFMVYVYPENRDPTDFGMGFRGLNPALQLGEFTALVFTALPAGFKGPCF